MRAIHPQQHEQAIWGIQPAQRTANSQSFRAPWDGSHDESTDILSRWPSVAKTCLCKKFVKHKLSLPWSFAGRVRG